MWIEVNFGAVNLEHVARVQLTNTCVVLVSHSDVILGTLDLKSEPKAAAVYESILTDLKTVRKTRWR
jgi:hypothetical protein